VPVRDGPCRSTGQQLGLHAIADGIKAFCQAARAGLAAATFDPRRQLAELLIGRVIVTDDQAESAVCSRPLPRSGTALLPVG
jgi:hypothetical protein